jgi:hypothetical protein
MMHRTRSTDVGASQLIIDGKIKLKNDAQIANFTEKGLEFADGSTLDADAVVFATGYVVCLFLWRRWHMYTGLEKRETRCAKYSDQRLAPASSKSGGWTLRAR